LRVVATLSVCLSVGRWPTAVDNECLDSCKYSAAASRRENDGSSSSSSSDCGRKSRGRPSTGVTARLDDGRQTTGRLAANPTDVACVPACEQHVHGKLRLPCTTTTSSNSRIEMGLERTRETSPYKNTKLKYKNKKRKQDEITQLN